MSSGEDKGPSALKNIGYGAAVGTGVTSVGVPATVAALGFSGAGITTGSVAAGMMGTTAVASGGGVAAGSTVAVLQSIGASSLFVYALPIACVGAAVGLTVGGTIFGIKKWRQRRNQ